MSPDNTHPCDWGGEQWCADGCGRPAMHHRLTGMVGDTPLYEIVCCIHAQEPDLEPA